MLRMHGSLQTDALRILVLMDTLWRVSRGFKCNIRLVKPPIGITLSSWFAPSGLCRNLTIAPLWRCYAVHYTHVEPHSTPSVPRLGLHLLQAVSLGVRFCLSGFRWSICGAANCLALSALRGGDNAKPCPKRQPSCRSSWNCSTVSTCSATHT